MIFYKYILDKILNKNTLIFIGVSLFVLLFLRQCNQIENLKIEIDNAQKISNRNLNNYKASLDTIKFEKNKNEETIAKIRSYELEVSDLNKSKANLIKKYNNVLSINKDVEEINSVISADLEVKDSIINATSIITKEADTTTLSIFDNKEWDKYNWRRFNGSLRLRVNDSSFNLLSSEFNFSQGISLTAGIIKTTEGNSLKITSPYPNLTFTRIENLNLVNDELNRPMIGKSGWSIGFGVGYGLNLNPNQVISVGPTIGVGLYWSPKWLRF